MAIMSMAVKIIFFISAFFVGDFGCKNMHKSSHHEISYASLTKKSKW